MKDLLIIVRKDEETIYPYDGPACHKAKVRPGLYYSIYEREYAQAELSKLNKIEPGAFKLKAIPRDWGILK